MNMKINRKRILKLAEKIEANIFLASKSNLKAYNPKLGCGVDNYFNMGFYQFDCGSPACLAGHTVNEWGITYHPNNISDLCAMDVFDLAKDFLGLNEYIAECLFSPFTSKQLEKADADAITPRWAAKVLRHLAETGEVRWEKFMPLPELDIGAENE